MFGLGWPEVVVIVTVLFLLLGAKRIPELGSSLGKSLRSFKAGLNSSSSGDEDQS